MIAVVIVSALAFAVLGLCRYESWRERVGIHRRYSREQDAAATAARIQANLDRLEQS